MPFRFVWPIEQFYSPRVQCAVYGNGPIISGPGAILARLWMTYGYTFIWLCLILLILTWRRHRRVAARARHKKKSGPANE